MSGFSARALTAPGTAAIAAVRVEGAGAAVFLAGCLAERGRAANRPVRLPAAGRHRWLTWQPGGAAVDDVIVVALPAVMGGGYEVHGHGGAAFLGLWQTAVTRGGGQWDPAAAFSAEPLHTLAAWQADFARVWTQVETGAQAAVVAASQALVTERFRQEPVWERWPAAWKAELAAGAEPRIERLLTPQRVLLAGPVNAGKSTLLNALLADRRALTSDQPGTTRDLVTGRIELAGMAVELIDSAGLRAGAGAAPETTASARAAALEAQGIALTAAMQSQAAWTVWLSPADAPAAPPADWQRVSVAVSKGDLTGGRTAVGVVVFSAKTGAGLPALLAQVAEALLPATAREAASAPGVCSRAQWAMVQV